MADLPGEFRAWLESMVKVVQALRGDVVVRLGDGAGGNKLRILDASGVEVAYIDSDGVASFANGPGDMTKAVYDPDEDGSVELADYADQVPWTGVQDKPTTFPPNTHTHDGRYYTETEMQISGAAAMHWDNLFAKPAYFTPNAHKTSHQHSGSDEVGTATPAANVIPKADGSGKLDGWVSDASITVKGKVELATDSEVAAGLAVQANDGRLSNARTPAAHKTSHQSGGADALALGSIAGTIDDTQHGNRGGGALHSVATTSAAGFESAADKQKVDSIPGMGIVGCTAYLDLTNSLADVIGLSVGPFTPSNNEYAYVQIVTYFNVGAGTAACNAGDLLVAFLNTNGVEEATRAVVIAPGATGVFCAVCWYRITLTAGTPYTLKVRARNTSASRGRASTDSHMMIWRVAR